MAAKNVVVTGGSGRLGRYVVAELSRHGHAVTVFDRVPTPDQARFVAGDVMDIASVRRALEGADAVVHLAGLDVDFGYPDEDYIRVNVTGSWHILQAATELGVPKVVLTSSIAATGVQDARPDHPPIYLPMDEKQPERPIHPYGVSKKLIEEAAKRVAERGKSSIIVLRPMLVLLPPAIPELVARSQDPKDRWLFYYVTAEDAAQAFRRAVEAEGIDLGIYFISAADSCTAVPTLDLVKRLWPGTVPVRKPELYAANPHASLFDCSAARQALGYEPTSRWTELAGIRR